MRALWGAVTEISDLGVVAEHCPHCERLMPCLLRIVCRGDYVLFVKMTDPLRETSCLCTGCLKPFPCEHYWRYSVVPVGEAKDLALEELLTRTNPALADRLKFQEQVSALGGDPRFATAYEQVESLRPGRMRSEFLRQVLDWDRLNEEQRTALAGQIGARARAGQLARQVAPGFPRTAGCLTFAVTALVVAQPFLWLLPVRGWLRITIAVAAGLSAALLANHVLLKRLVRRWTRKVLIPAAQEINVSLDSFSAVVDDVPGSRLGMMEDLWPMKYQLDTIRAVLVAEGKLKA